MLASAFNENGNFRGMVEKLLVSPEHRKKGNAGAMMRKLEEVARQHGKLLLVAAARH
ncbi:hypothetical protein M7I_1269 [Glarea lozoyensis 74030]|uniref:N-acetyltransferase domain-containing protein n=1 Tax=Glarea lozoyensis (strain ATCC 74030 / MF5533) TaxID=1104152 RepID=H0EFJ3_GLAL7|nr:hypothetical protein M7I_1269 [Glarea lozoyensis 74030]